MIHEYIIQNVKKVKQVWNDKNGRLNFHA